MCVNLVDVCVSRRLVTSNSDSQARAIRKLKNGLDLAAKWDRFYLSGIYDVIIKSWNVLKQNYPLPNVGSPNTTARLLSFNAPAKISLALAVPLFTCRKLRKVVSAIFPQRFYAKYTMNIAQKHKSKYVEYSTPINHRICRILQMYKKNQLISYKL